MVHKRGLMFGVLLAVLLGFGLRVMLADFHSLEGDDAFSLAVSHTPTDALVRGLMRLELDIHPPLHFLTLKAWTALTGETLIGLRLLNILLDVLTVALWVRLVRRTDIGWAWVLVWSVSPVLIFGGWLLRMYGLLGFLTVAALAAAVEARYHARRVGWLVLAFGLALAAMYTHITGVLTLAAVVMVCLWDARHHGRRAGVVLGLALMVGLAYLPFALPIARLYLSGATLGAEVNPANSLPLWQIPSALILTTVGHRLTVWFGLAVLWLIPLFDRDRWRNHRGLGLAVGVTFIGMVALGMVGGLYKARYIVPFAPLWVAFVFVGRRVWERAVWVIVLVTVGIIGLSHNLQYGWRDDWTAAAHFIEAHTVAGDVIVVVPDWGQEALRYHYKGAATVRGFFPQIAPTLDLDAAFGSYLNPARRVWLVRYQPTVSDPDSLAQAWFDRQYSVATVAYPAGMEVTLYHLQPANPFLLDSATPIDATFGDVLALRGVTLPTGFAVDADDRRLFDGSGRALVALHWQALQALDDGQRPRVRLTDTYGQVYGEAVMHGRGVAWPSVETWPPEQVMTMYYDLNLNPTTPAGVYNVEVMVLDATGAPMPATGGDAGEFWVVAGQVTVR